MLGSDVSFSKVDGSCFQEISNLIQKKINAKKLEQIAFNCNVVSKTLCNLIKKHTNHNAVLTVGTIICENKDLFCSASSFNDDFLNLVCSLGDGGLNNKEYSHHAWITLDTMEVIDFTYAASFQIANPKTDTCTPFNFNYLFKHPDNFTDAMYYKPMLVGDAFYRKFDNLRYMLGKMMSENIWR